jgi:hypothetical protein
VNKSIIILFLFCISFVNAKETLLLNNKSKIVFTTKDIQKDTSTIKIKTFETNFKRKYKSKEFVYEEKQPEKSLWQQFLEWLARLFGQSDGKASAAFIGTLFRTIAIVIVVIVVYLIVKALMNKEGKWIFGRNSDKKIINYIEVEKNILTTDFESLIKKTLASGEQRLCIRYYYLWLLKKMSEKEIIKWDIEKTNSDYLYEIKSETKKEEFQYLSYLYNNIWYGEFDLNDAIFEKAKASFEKGIKSI